MQVAWTDVKLCITHNSDTCLCDLLLLEEKKKSLHSTVTHSCILHFHSHSHFIPQKILTFALILLGVFMSDVAMADL